MKKITIEVLGSAAPQYLSHKKNIADKAKEHCDYYISVPAYNLQKDDAFVKKLNGVLSRVDLLYTI